MDALGPFIFNQPSQAFHGVTLPFGGAKGAALALVMDIFSGLFTAAPWQRIHGSPPGVVTSCSLMKLCSFFLWDLDKSRIGIVGLRTISAYLSVASTLFLAAFTW